MKITSLFFTGIITGTLFTFTAAAQTTGPAQEKFYTNFVEVYTELSKPPLVNYFLNLNNTVELTFTTDNKLYVPALTEISKKAKITEAIASDSLFNYSLKKLLAEKLWVSFPSIYAENLQAFKAYNDELCPCISQNFKATDYIGKLMPAVQKCVSQLATDTVSVNNIRRSAGDKTLADIFRNQQYFSLYIYQNCSVANSSMNQTLRAEAFSKYASARSIQKNNSALNVLNYFRDKKVDSLALIFPAYKKFSKELNEALALSKTKDTRNTAYGLNNDGEISSIKNFFNNDAQLGDLIVSFAGETIYATVTKVAFKKQLVPKVDDTAEMPAVDTTAPKKQ